MIRLKQGQIFVRTQFMHRLVQSLYSRTTAEFSRGHFRVQGDILDVFPGYSDTAFRVHFFGDEVELIESFDPINNQILESFESVYHLSR